MGTSLGMAPGVASLHRGLVDDTPVQKLRLTPRSNFFTKNNRSMMGDPHTLLFYLEVSMAFVFSQRSINNLKGVHPKLVAVITKALEYTEYDFVVTEGVRSYERQVQLKAEGKSKTLKSYHLKHDDGYGHAIDVAALVPGGGGKSTVSWDLKYYAKINEAVQKAASELGAKITWGGSWKTFVDSPHFQLEV